MVALTAACLAARMVSKLVDSMASSRVALTAVQKVDWSAASMVESLALATAAL